SGTIQINLSAVDDQGNNVTAQGDDVVGIYRPNVTACEVSGGEIRVAWERIPDVDHYTIFRNSKFLVTLDATVTETTDAVPDNPPPTVTYEVAGEIKGVRGPRGACVAEIKGDTDPGTTAPPSNLSVKLAPRSAPTDPNSLTVQWDNGEKY